MKAFLLVMSLLLTSTVVFSEKNRFDCQDLHINHIQQCKMEVDGGKLYSISNMPYALCSKAYCKMDDNEHYADCHCSIQGGNDWKSISLSPSGYLNAQPTYDNGQLQTVQSNYSMANIKDFDHHINTVCKSDKPVPWANCFGVRCKVEKVKHNGKVVQQARCHCPVERSKSYILGMPKQSDCQTPDGLIWSAANNPAFLEGEQNPMIILYKHVAPDAPPLASGSIFSDKK